MWCYGFQPKCFEDTTQFNRFINNTWNNVWEAKKKRRLRHRSGYQRSFVNRINEIGVSNKFYENLFDNRNSYANSRLRFGRWRHHCYLWDFFSVFTFYWKNAKEISWKIRSLRRARRNIRHSRCFRI